MERVRTETAPTSVEDGENGLAIEIRDLCKTFGSFQAIDHLSLEVERGEIFGLLGPNGSGKTTTINMLSGLSVPGSGTVKVMGYDIRHHARQIRRL